MERVFYHAPPPENKPKAKFIMTEPALFCYTFRHRFRKQAVAPAWTPSRKEVPMADSTRASERILLTGLTGLVGSSVVVALARARRDCSFVCLVRGAGGRSTEQRAQDVLRDECAFEGCPEVYDEVQGRVTAIEGDVTSIDPEQLAAHPLLKDVTKVLHCAADVNLGKDPTGRVFTVNFEGTRRMVELAQRLGVKEFHYVATAYVAGKQTGVIYEKEQHPPAFNNPYEESKCKAEMLVRESGLPFTIYRPGIIVGRKSDGRIRKPLAFYRILEFLQKLKERAARRKGLPPGGWVDMDMNCRTVASDHIYFVPIDYVQAAIADLFQRGTSGETYHVTGDHPVSANQILRAVCRVFRIDGLTVGMDRECKSAEEAMFSKFVGDLFPYFSSDLVFDQQNIRRDFAGLAQYDYGSADLEVLTQAYLADHYRSVAWVREMISQAPGRDPR